MRKKKTRNHTLTLSEYESTKIPFAKLSSDSESYFIFGLDLREKNLEESRKSIEEIIKIVKRDENIRVLICVTINPSKHKALVRSVAESLNLIWYPIQNPSINLISDFSLHIRKVSHTENQPNKVLTFWGRKNLIKEENEFLKEKERRIRKAEDQDEELKDFLRQKKKKI